MPYYCYLLECGDGSFYCGWTNNLKKRIKTHASGKGGRYTRAHLPVELAYFEECESQSSAMQREGELKQKTHSEKRKMIEIFQSDNTKSIQT